MRRLIGLLVIAAALWSGWWFAVSYGLRQGIEAAIVQQERRGWDVTTGAVETRGFPLTHRTRIDGLQVIRGIDGWQTAWADLQSPAIWPGDQTLRLSPEQVVQLGRAVYVLSADDLLAHLRFQPGLALTLDAINTRSGPWTAVQNGATVLSGDGVDLAFSATQTPVRYDVALDLPGLAPGDGIRQMIRAPEGLPRTLGVAGGAGEILFDRPLDRHSLNGPPPQPREIVVEAAQLTWGDLGLGVTGSLQMDAQGVPEGVLQITVRNWKQVVAMVRDAQTLPPGLLNSVERALTMLSMLGGQAGELTLQLNFRDGVMALGPLPLGPAPLIRF